MNPIPNPGQPLLAAEAFVTFCEGMDRPECLAFQLMRVDRSGRVPGVIADVKGVPLVNPNFSVFDSEGNLFDLYVANLGRWHISRVQRLINMKQAMGRDETR